MSMRRVNGVRALPARSGSRLVAIGNFDGVHLGHQAVLHAAIQESRALGLEPLVLTFHPHPLDVLGGHPRLVLTPIDRKVELLCRVDPALRVVVEPFTRELADTSAEDFVRDVLVRALGAKVVIVGQNFRFGRRRSGDLGVLRELGAGLGLRAEAEPLIGDERGAFSSSRIREAVLAGEVENAERWLGHPHAMTGRVVSGDGRGRTIGVPTANLGAVEEVLPAHGVYACLVDDVTRSDGKALARAVCNVGVRPTFGAGAATEVHLLDFSGDLYGRMLRVHLVRRLREERRFPGLPELVEQIGRDLELARAVLADRKPDPAAEGAWH